MFKKTTSTLAIAGLSLTGIFIATPAMAVEDTTIQTITESSLSNLGLENVSPELIDEISSSISEVVNSEEDPTVNNEILNPEIVDIVETQPENETVIDDSLDNNLQEQEKLWDAVKSDWLEAYEAVKADFDECLAAGTAANECSAGLGFKLQIAHGEALLKNYDQRIADIALLPEDQQAEQLRYLEQQRSRVLERLERAQAKIEDNINNGTPLPKGVKIKNIEGEAELVNGLLADLGSEEKAIPAEPRKVQLNSDGTFSITGRDGTSKTIAPKGADGKPMPAPTYAPQAPQGNVETNQVAPQQQSQQGQQQSPAPAPAPKPAPNDNSQKPAPQGKQQVNPEKPAPPQPNNQRNGNN